MRLGLLFFYASVVLSEILLSFRMGTYYGLLYHLRMLVLVVSLVNHFLLEGILSLIFLFLRILEITNLSLRFLIGRLHQFCWQSHVLMIFFVVHIQTSKDLSGLHYLQFLIIVHCAGRVQNRLVWISSFTTYRILRGIKKRADIWSNATSVGCCLLGYSRLI